MNPQSISNYFVADHKRLECLYASFKAKLGSDEALCYFWAFKKGIEQNIKWEEEVLFPFFEEKMGISHDPTDVMLSEHRDILEYLVGIDEYLLSNRDVAPLLLALEEVLEAHNQKEEQILFPLIDDYSNGVEKADLFLALCTTRA
ncbi:hemerythrin domain-containing protein [Pseudoalteromonas pernae]|uniref:hemerythrin domain-containing protein n=1 Tax=Pseudoalteromonas pernae TaxID=3118054 RepID=UPI0032421A1A